MMRIVAPVLVLCFFLFASCAKEEVDGFDSQITIASDFKIDPATGDTFYRFYMPNGFTPNSDGLNDTYFVIGTGFDYPNFSLRITSRENNLVFSSTSPNQAWSGAVQGHGDLSANGVYSVEVNVDDTSHEHHHYVYDIIMFR